MLAFCQVNVLNEYDDDDDNQKQLKCDVDSLAIGFGFNSPLVIGYLTTWLVKYIYRETGFVLGGFVLVYSKGVSF